MKLDEIIKRKSEGKNILNEEEREREPLEKKASEKIGPIEVMNPVKEGGDFYIFQDLTQEFELETQYDVEERIIEFMEKNNPELLERINFDTEAGNFCVLGKDKNDIVEVAEIINEMIEF